MRLSDTARILGPTAVTEGETPDGSRWGVVLIRSGVSKNRNQYRREVLEAAALKYDGAHVYMDHSETGGPRSARDLAGFISSVGMQESDGVFELTGTLNVTSGALRESLQEAARLGKPDLFGLSHDARAKTSIVQVAGVGAVRDVLDIEEVLSVDVVSRPAAGGRVVRIAAGEGAVSAASEKEIEMFEKLLEQYKTLRPGATVKEGITEDELVTLVTEAMKAVAAPKADAKPAPAPVAPVAAALTEDDRAMLREALIDRAFAGRALPETVTAKVRKELAARPALTLVEAQGVIDEWVETLAPLSDQVRGSGSGSTVRTTVDEADKKLKALDAFFQSDNGASVDGIAPYRGFQEAYIDITGDRDLTGRLSEARGLSRFARLKEGMTTASWGEILGDSIHRSLLADYRTPSQYDAWRSIVSDVTSPRDFRTNRRMRLAGYGDLTAVAEAQPYPAVTSPTDEEATYSVSKRGGIETITMEMIANDDVGAIRRIPRNLSLAAKRTLYKSVFDPLRTNAAIYDTLALAEATTHNNISTTALSQAEIVAARIKMAEQTGYGATDVLDLSPKILIVPAELEEIGWRLTNIPMHGNTNRDATEPSFTRSRVGLDTLIVLPYWADNNNWWLVANPREIPTIEVGFYQGRQEPELFVADNPTVGSMFTADKIDYKIRFIWGVAVLDFRGFYGGIVP